VWPTVEQKLPPFLKANAPSLLDQVTPQLQKVLSGAMQDALPMIIGKLPDMITAATPTIQAKLPGLLQTATPYVEAEIDKLANKYSEKYLGVSAKYQEYITILGVVASSFMLFASGIIIYDWYARK